jgi:CheY-like chemotaxis protein
VPASRGDPRDLGLLNLMANPTVAVVEDNADNRLLLQAILGDRYELVEYDNGTDALAGIRSNRPQLVLLDISLPGMDGTEILHKLRDDVALRGLPVIALTAHAMAGDREKFLAAGFDDYITKPIIDENELFQAIERLLGKH